MTDSGATLAAQLVAFARQTHPQLEKLSYYQLLRVPNTADTGVVRAAYYRMAAQLHPDRYLGLPDRAARDQLESIYARINEGYRVLIAPERRMAYDRGLAQGKVRLELTNERAANAPKNPTDSLKHPQSKKFFQMGMICMGKKDWKAAVMNFNFAKTFEPDAAAITEKVAEAQAALKAATPAGPPSK